MSDLQQLLVAAAAKEGQPQPLRDGEMDGTVLYLVSS